VELVARLRPSPGLDRIKATLLAINSADDERNPPELGLLDREIKRVPAGPDTVDDGATGQARLWMDALAELLATAPRLSN
jgi:homoserine O-acetyltransferase